MTLYRWSQNAAADATADSSINWQEGQAPSSINDSARAMMAATAKFRDDISGAIATSGTSTAYTVTSYQAFDSLSHLNGQMIAFTPHATNGATVTLNVDSLGAKPLRSAPGIELPAGVLVQGTPYVALYNDSDQAFYLHGFFNNPYNVPIGASIDYWGSTAPNSSFVLMYGQTISRTVYAALFSIFGATYGSGDGSTTFNIPDCRGRVVAGIDNMGGSVAGRLTTTYFGGNASALGATGGGESTTLIATQIPTITSSGSNTISVDSTTPNTATGGIISSGVTGGAARVFGSNGINEIIHSQGSNNITVNSVNTAGLPHRTVQPTIVASKLLRII